MRDCNVQVQSVAVRSVLSTIRPIVRRNNHINIRNKRKLIRGVRKYTSQYTNQMEITYQPTGNEERGKIQRYHNKPNPRVLSMGAYKKDVEKLKCVKVHDSYDGTYKSLYCIGMEVEKNQLHRGAVKE